MILTKEECLFALESLKPANIYEFKEKGYLSFIKANYILTQLIEEHFEIIKERERLEKAYDKAIKKITLDNDEGFDFLDNQYEYWKEWSFKDID